MKNNIPNNNNSNSIQQQKELTEKNEEIKKLFDDGQTFLTANSTKNDDTKQKYEKRAMQLLKKAQKELGGTNSANIDVRQFVIWLNEQKTTLSRSTWRQYKSSVIYYLQNHIDQSAAMEAIEWIKDITSIGCVKKSEKTSSLKLKKITIEDWIRLDGYLKNKQNKWYKELRYWLRSAIITGLRPIEWHTCKLEKHEGEACLLIQNAKNTNGRAHGPTRTLILKELKQEDIFAIKSHLDNIRTFIGMGEYEYFYNGCSTSLYKACRKIWPRRKKHITLYSTRHQFSANAKSSGFSRAEIAAMMGHAVDITAAIHYGRKKAGYETVNISPIKSEVSKIKHVQSISEFKESSQSDGGNNTNIRGNTNNTDDK